MLRLAPRAPCPLRLATATGALYSLVPDHAHVFLLADGAFLFLLRVIDDMPSESPDASLWRVLGQRPQPLAQLVQAEPSGAPVWVSSFPVAHCIAEPLAKDGVYWAGDAAHIHSPIEARGMNLGLEDAWGFAHLAQRDCLAQYDERRRSVDRQVVRQVKLLSKVAGAESHLFRLLQHFLLSAAISCRLSAYGC